MLVQVTTANAGSWLPDTSLRGFEIRRQARTTRSEVDRELRVLVKRVASLSHAHLADSLQSVLGLKQKESIGQAAAGGGAVGIADFDAIATDHVAMPCALQPSC